tara:strand:- start:601 stop:906 length:306 start_codon:yes stop_codon:yes gene_type:complete
MKKIIFSIITILFVLVAFGTNSTKESTKTVIESEISINVEQPYYKGFKDGWDEGWKDVKGKYSYPPYAPYPSYPTYPKSVDSYRDGYNDGFKAGRRKALKS